jgi:starch phosphorylase
MSSDGPKDFLSPLPPALAPIGRLALNLRWVWNHAADRVWEALNAEVWHQTRNPILVLQNTPRSRLDELARDTEFVERVRRIDRSESEYLSRPSWFQITRQSAPGMVA